MDIIIVVGLGNPGTEYDGTRHNLGFEVIDELAARFRTVMKSGRGEYKIAPHRVGGRYIILAKPTTYMNNSGTAAKDLLDSNGVPPSELIVIADDIALPLGTLRLRAKGSDGGHNGLHSIIRQLETDEFARIRCGIRPDIRPRKERMADFVLSPFEKEERPLVDQMVVRGADAVIEFATSGIAKAMNKFNARL